MVRFFQPAIGRQTGPFTGFFWHELQTRAIESFFKLDVFALSEQTRAPPWLFGFIWGACAANTATADNPKADGRAAMMAVASTVS